MGNPVSARPTAVWSKINFSNGSQYASRVPGSRRNHGARYTEFQRRTSGTNSIPWKTARAEIPKSPVQHTYNRYSESAATSTIKAGIQPAVARMTFRVTTLCHNRIHHRSPRGIIWTKAKVAVIPINVRITSPRRRRMNCKQPGYL